MAAGDAVLDVGCGTGDLMVDLAESISPGVLGVGIDSSNEMIRIARQRSQDRGLRVKFAVGDACRLPFAAAAFDGVHCERVLMHFDDPEAAVREMSRVLVPGGRLVVTEPDWAGWILDSDDAETTSAVRESLARRIRNAGIGRKLYRLALITGLEVMDFRAELLRFPNLSAMETALSFSLISRLD